MKRWEMIKGFMSQGLMVLTEEPFSPDAVDHALGNFKVVKRELAQGEKNWMGGYPSWTVEMRPEVNGLVVVEVIDAPWPDHMGDPKSEPHLVAAWSIGLMGPGAFPGGLERAKQYAGIFGNQQVVEAAGRHRAFVRISSSYVLGKNKKDAPLLPADYNAVEELQFVTSIAAALLQQPGALCYYDPAGETLLDQATFEHYRKTFADAGLPTILLWTSVRMIRLDDAPPWFVADLVGMQQLDLTDMEACFRRGVHDAGEVRAFLGNIATYILKEKKVIESGHTADGPGGKWRALLVNESLLPPPRPVLRWFPEDDVPPPPSLRPQPPPLPSGKKSGFFARLFGSYVATYSMH